MSNTTATTAAAPLMSKAAYRREIRACWYALETLMHDTARASEQRRRDGYTDVNPDDYRLLAWAPGQGDMRRLLDDLARDCRRHRRAAGAPPSSAWRLSVEEDGYLMILRFVARAEPGPWAPSADTTRWYAYGNAIGAVLAAGSAGSGDRRPADWLARVRAIDAQPRFIAAGY